MFLELIATVVAGLACAGVALLLNIVTGRRLPRWVMPVAAGAGMIGMTISNEYTWFPRTTERLPEGLSVALTVEEQSWARPWTKIWPYTKRFIAVDTGTVRTNPNVPDQRLGNLYFFGRWSPVNQVPVLFDCEAARTATLADGAEFSDDGSVRNADWEAIPDDDPILKKICDT